MALSALDDKTKIPDDHMLAEVLGESKRWWDAILAHLAEEYAGMQAEWGFTDPKSGWSLRPKYKKRTILYLIPGHDCFTASLALGEKAVAAAEESTLPESILDAVRHARRYPEGRGVKVEVRRRADVDVVQKMVEIKMMH